MGRGAWQAPRGLKESDTSEPLSLPLHVMILKSKLTVIIKISLKIQEFLNDPKQDKGDHSVDSVDSLSSVQSLSCVQLFATP